MKKNNFKIIELKPAKNTTKRTIFIKDFIIHEIIGIHDYEKAKDRQMSILKTRSDRLFLKSQLV